MTNTSRKRWAIVPLGAAFLGCIAAGSMLGFTHHSASAEGELPDPIAKYLFDDDSDIGKDSVGNYGMSIVGGKNEYTKVDGGIEFNGNFAIAQSRENNIFKDLTEFTICFEYKMLANNSAWNSILGVSNVGDGNYMFLDSSGGDTRFHASDATKDGASKLGTIWDGVQLNCNSYTRMTITAKPGGQINVYLNGTVSTSEGKIPADLPAGWTPYNTGDNECLFAVGAPVSNAGAVGTAGKAGVKELVFYDKEFTAAEVAQYWNEYEASHAKVASAEFDFSDSITVANAASAAHVLKYATNGAYEVTMSDNTKATATITWTGVVAREGAKYLEGTVSGVNNPDGVKAYAKINAIDTKVVSAEVDSGAVFPATATDAQIMGAVKNGEYEVTLEDGTKMVAVITWTGVQEEGGKKYIEGTLAEVNNPDNVKAKGSVTVGSSILQPFARYEFQDASNAGKDSAGNYNLKATGNPVVNNGEVTFDGKSGLTAANFLDKLQSFSLTFQIKMPDTFSNAWVTPIGFGGGTNSSPAKWFTFNFPSGSRNLLFAFADRQIDGKGNIIETTNECWGLTLGSIAADSYSRVTVTVEVGGKCRIYFNGTEKGVYDVPADFDISRSNMMLALGYDPSNSGRNFTGTLKDVRLYDCALTPGQVGALETFGETYPHDGSLYISSVDSNTLAFSGGKPTTGDLYDNLNEATMLSKMNEATVTATLSNGSTQSFGVIWNAVVQEGGKYYAKGWIQSVGVGATVVAREDFTYELEVIRILDVVTATDLTGGTITANRANAMAGTQLVLTVTPEEGYEITSVTVNGNPIAAADGKYTYTVTNEDTELYFSATFTKVWKVTCLETANGTVTADKATAYLGDTITLTITPAQESELVEVLLNGAPFTATEGVYLYTVTDESPATLAFSALFRKTMPVTCETAINGTVSADKATAALGDEITLTVTPAAGYVIGEVKVNGTAIEAQEGVYKYTVGANDAALNFTATFIKQVTIVCNGAENGTVTADKTSALAGDTITLTVTPDEGYEIDSVKVNGTAIEAKNGVYSFTAEDDSTVSVTFKQKATPVTPEPAKKGCGATADSLLALLGGAVVLAAVAIVVKKSKKKN